MKIVITGHTKGIGLPLYKQLVLNGHQVVGFSRSEGTDIGSRDSHTAILRSIENADVFINNAYHVTGQHELLTAVADKWKGTNKLIVNVNSKAIFGDVIHPAMEEYVAAKKKQYDYIASKRLESRPQLLNVSLGLVDTEMSTMFDAKKLPPAYVANLIAMLIDYKDAIYVQDIMIDVPDQNWTEIKGRDDVGNT